MDCSENVEVSYMTTSTCSPTPTLSCRTKLRRSFSAFDKQFRPGRWNTEVLRPGNVRTHGAMVIRLRSPMTSSNHPRSMPYFPSMPPPPTYPSPILQMCCVVVGWQRHKKTSCSLQESSGATFVFFVLCGRLHLVLKS